MGKVKGHRNPAEIKRRIGDRLSALSRGDDWKNTFKKSHETKKEARNYFRAEIKKSLNGLIDLFVETWLASVDDAERSELAEDDGRNLQWASSLLAFRLLFLFELENRGILFSERTLELEFSLDELLGTILDRPDTEYPWDYGELVEQLVTLSEDIRNGGNLTEISGGSIFENNPDPDNFDEGIADWLRLVEHWLSDNRDEELRRRWDETLAKTGEILVGYVESENEKRSSRFGSGGSGHTHRILGDIYEEILALGTEVEDGKVTLDVPDGDSEQDKLGAHYTPQDLVEEVVRPTLGHLFRKYWDESENLQEYRERLRNIKMVDPSMGSAHFLTETALEIARELAWTDDEFYNEPRFIMLEGNEENDEGRKPQWDEPLEHENSIGLDDVDVENVDVVPSRKGEIFYEPGRQYEYEEAVQAYLSEVIQRSIYGVDINPIACELGKLSLWLFEVDERDSDEDYPELTYLDGNIKCGDSLVGVFLEDIEETIEKIIDSDDTKEHTLNLFNQKTTETIEDKLEKAKDYRRILETLPRHRADYREATAQRILDDENLNIDSLTSDYEKSENIDEAMNRYLQGLEWLYDLTLAARFIDYGSGKGAKKRSRFYRALLGKEPPNGGDKHDKSALDAALRELFDHPESEESKGYRDNLEKWIEERDEFNRFHWELEFPDIFADGGFDGLFTNPPFIGSQKIKKRIGAPLQSYLGSYYFDGKAPEYSAFFFSRYDLVLNNQAAFSSLAPNTIAQGKVRRAALVPLIKKLPEQRRFEILRACQNRTWPNEASVNIAIVSASRFSSKGLPRKLIFTDWESDPEGNTFGLVSLASNEKISSYLDGLPDYNLAELEATKTLSSLHYYDSVNPLVANGFNIGSEFKFPLARYDEVPKEEKEVFYAYYNNQTIKKAERPSPETLVIDFTDILLKEGKYNSPKSSQIQWLEENYSFSLSNIKNSVSSRSGRWWLFERDRLPLRKAWSDLEQVIVFGDVSKCWTPRIIDKVDSITGREIRVTKTLYVIPRSDFAVLGVLLSAVFEIHLRRVSSSVGAGMSTIPSEAFPTFSMPWDSSWSAEECRPVLGTPPENVKALIEPRVRELLSLRSNLLDSPPEKFKSRTSKRWGITKLYNNFDDPTIKDERIAKLRAAHRKLLDSVAKAYGWQEIIGCRWEFSRPWLDGSYRYVPKKETRAKILERIEYANRERRKQESRLFCEKLARELPPDGSSISQLRKSQFVKQFPIPTSSNEYLQSILQSGQEQGVVKCEDGNWYGN